MNSREKSHQILRIFTWYPPPPQFIFPKIQSNMEVTIAKTCLTCYKPIRGRIDKKFCDDYCRSTYNNRINGEGAPYLRLINSTLKKNRRILEDLFPPTESAMKLHRTKLLESGYNFKYTTHT